MKIATKTLATLLIVTALSLSIYGGPVAATPVQFDRADERLEKLHKHHDRKFELWASVLNMQPDELREELKAKTLDQIIKKRGFKNREAFNTALVGKMKEELFRRGWSEHKIEALIQKRADRLAE